VRDRTGVTPWPAVTEVERPTIERTEGLLPGSEFAAQVTSGRRQEFHQRGVNVASTSIPLSVY
jgi:hypothetical protein